MPKIDSLDLEDLAVALCELNPDMETSEIESAFFEKYGINMEEFHTLMNDIFPLITLDYSPLSNAPYVGIGKGAEWFIKKECKDTFIRCALEYFQNKNNVIITAGGQPKFEVIVKKITGKAKEGGAGK